jgi:glycine dehydrogenase subunit 1
MTADDKRKSAHPYIPNSVPSIQARMLEAIGAADIEEFYENIPEALRVKGKLDLPEPMASEQELRRHVGGILSRNRSCAEMLCFRGGGCAPHYVPAICDEINRRSEFLTAYAGEPYEDLGRFQVLFEYASLMGELLDLDVVNVPTFDWNQAASTSIRMAQRINGRSKIVISEHVPADRLSTITNYCRSAMQIAAVRIDAPTGLMDLADLEAKLSRDAIGVYFENPSYLGCIDHQGRRIAELVHAAGGLCIVGVDPISLGVLAPPSHYGADIVCGDLQPLGMHMFQGGGQAGFIATRDEERFVREYPSRLFGITETTVPGEWGFGDVLYDDRTSFGAREKGKEFVGTATALWGLTAGVYLALMGPSGMTRVGRTILMNTRYAMKVLGAIEGVEVGCPDTAHFKEFVIDLNATGTTPAAVNERLLESGILGGIDLAGQVTGGEGRMLICVTELHSSGDIDRLGHAVATAVAGKSPRTNR